MQFVIPTHKREELIDITNRVQLLISRYSIKEGLANIFVPHATAAITVNENADPDALEDFLKAMGKIAPEGIWKHDKVDENGDAHIKAAIIKPDITIPIQNNRLMLGKWQSIFLCEFDGPRERTVIVNVWPCLVK
jgi:secondary thiamine-phosphate synthase enzyme